MLQKSENQKTLNKTSRINSENKAINVKRKFKSEFVFADKIYVLFMRQLTSKI